MQISYYALLDGLIKFNFKDSLYDQVNKLGYTYISQYVYDRYYNAIESIEQIGLNINVSIMTAKYWMHKWNFKIRTRGENNAQRNRCKETC